MKKIILSACAIALLCACNTTHYNAVTVYADHTNTTTLDNSRCMWSSQGYTANLTTNGGSITCSASTTDSQTIAAVTKAAVEGAVSSAK
jgi:hypothetical protein